MRVTVLYIPTLEGGTILLSGILNRNVNVDPQLDELATINQDGDKCNTESDDGSNCEIEESVY